MILRTINDITIILKKNRGINLLFNLLFISSLLFLSGCANQKFSFPVVTSSEKSGDLILESGVFKTEMSEYKADYGSLVVTENSANINSRLIELPVIRIHSSSSTPAEPIFLLSGGPGGSNIRFTPPDYMLANHDFVMVGYRGVDGPSILACPEVEEALKSEGVLTKKFIQKSAEAFKHCSKRLTNDGVDLNGYTIMDVIEDMEAARIALNYPKINLASGSYGTRVAYIYGLKYPQSIYRSAMVSANPPGHFGWEPETIDRQLKYFADLWAKDPDRIARTPDLLATMRNVAHNMPESWMFLPIDPGKVKMMTFNSLYSRAGAAKVFDAYIAAEQGDASGLALMSMAYDFVVPTSTVWGDYASKAFSADFDASRDYIHEMDPENSIIGSPSGKFAWGSLQSSGWPVQPIPQKYRQLQHSDVATLVISGSIDFSTPAEFATNELLPYLSNGKQVILSEAGHVGDVFRLKPEVTERLLMSFYDTGVVDESLNNYVPMDFNVDWGWPKTTKTGFGVSLGLLLLLLL